MLCLLMCSTSIGLNIGLMSRANEIDMLSSPFYAFCEGLKWIHSAIRIGVYQPLTETGLEMIDPLVLLRDSLTLRPDTRRARRLRALHGCELPSPRVL
jgi:hypothetical protein